MDKRKRGSKLTYSVVETLLPALILSVTAVFILIMLFNNIIPMLNNSNKIDIEQSIWEQAFLEAEKNKVGVDFTPITTTEKEYEQLRISCNQYIESSKPKLDASLEVSTVVKEEQFIDETFTLNDGINTSDTEQTTMSETGPIYFQDMLMIRYINTDGKLVVVTGAFDNNGDIVTMRQDELIEVASNTKNSLSAGGSMGPESSSGMNLDSNSTLNEAKHLNGQISEEDYLKSIQDTLESMLKAFDPDEIIEAEKKALEYFTYDGKETVFGNRDDIKLDKNAEIKTIYMEAGKSNSNKTYKDRIYAQLEITINGESTVVNIILKLNNNLRIYDIDLI